MPASGGREGDEIFLLAFRQIGCVLPAEVSSLSDLTPGHLVEIISRSLNILTDGKTQFASALPPGPASRHRLCTKMANEIKNLDYSGECGYNQILYPAEATTRSILGFLVEKLPREEETMQEDMLGPNALLNRRILASIVAWRDEPFVRACCPVASGSNKDGMAEPRFKCRALVTYPIAVPSGKEDSAAVPPVTGQVPEDKHVAPSLLERSASFALHEAAYLRELENAGMDDVAAKQRAVNAAAKRTILGALAAAAAREEKGSSRQGATSGGTRTLGEMLKELAQTAANGQGAKTKGTRFTHATEFGQEVSLPASVVGSKGGAAAQAAGGGGDGDAPLDPVEAAQRQAEAEQSARREEIAALEASIAELEGAMEAKARDTKMCKAKLADTLANLAVADESSAALEKEALTKQKTLAMLPKAAENISKLEGICQASAAKLAALQAEWEAHSVPLAESIEKKRNFSAARKAKCKDMVEEMKKARSEMHAMAYDVREKEEKAKLLQDELSRLPKNLNRTLYTYRIMDIISSIAKQKKEIDKIIVEVQQVQKDINSIGERLMRAEEVADAKIFATANRDAKKDATMVTAYRYLQNLRQSFDVLVSTISDIGKKETDARDLEGKAEQLAERISKNNTDQILADIQQVKQENAAVVTRLRSALE